MVKKNISYSGICWPERVVYDENGKFAGYIMPEAAGVEMAKSLFKTKKIIEKRFGNWDRRNLVNLALTILEKINYLHKHNTIIGDINARNILIKSDKEVYFVDTDSYQMDEFKCPVGTINFTAPEIQGKDYKTFFRTFEHEYFAVATLIFMIFLPGKPPYAYQGGGNQQENIKNKNFSYPVDDHINWRAPKGVWEFMWNDLPYDVKKAFYNTFKLDRRLSAEQWIKVLSEYKREMDENEDSSDYPFGIFPQMLEKNIENKSISMNRRKGGFGEIETYLNKECYYDPKIAVIEFSTKAVKVLSGNLKNLRRNGFSFDYFFRNSSLTNTGKGLDSKNLMNIEYFKNNVLTEAKKHIDGLIENNVDIVYSVATAAFRSAENSREMLKMMKDECGINVRVLSKEEEARATVNAFLFSGQKYIKDKNQDILLIDQGGGSTEVSVFRNDEIIYSYSLDVGTVVLENRLFANTNPYTPIKRAFNEFDKSIKQNKLNYYFRNNAPKVDNCICISVGTVITSATGKKGNKVQHGTILTKEVVRKKMLEIEEKLNEEYGTIGNLLEQIKNDDNSKNNSNKVDNLLIMRLGLYMYLEFMERLNINEIIVSGTGLWYGVYYENFKEIYG
jgi:serine/threonine protein kinase